MTKYAYYGYEGRDWVFYFWHINWSQISLGFHISLDSKNIEIHVPGGFLRLGKRSLVRGEGNSYRSRSPGRGWGWGTKAN